MSTRGAALVAAASMISAKMLPKPGAPMSFVVKQLAAPAPWRLSDWQCTPDKRRRLPATDGHIRPSMACRGKPSGSTSVWLPGCRHLI